MGRAGIQVNLIDGALREYFWAGKQFRHAGPPSCGEVALRHYGMWCLP